MNLFFKDFSVSQPVINRNSRNKIVSFGERNTFPDELMKMVNESPLQSAILNNKYVYTIGASLQKNACPLAPNPEYGWYDLIKRCAYDYTIFEAFAVQIIPNKGLSSFSFYHTPISQIRLGQYNDANTIEKAYLCADWSRSTNSNTIEIKMWGTETPKQGEKYLAYFRPYKTNELFYHIPSYYSAANWMLVDAALSTYYNNFIHNNFSANLAIKFPTEPTEDKKEELYKNLEKSFGGSHNAGNILCLFGENEVLPSIEPIESANADLYNQVSETVLKYIVSANRLTSPILAGLSTSSGFSSKSDEIIAAIALYKLTVIASDRQFILDKLNSLLELNGFDRTLVIEDYDLRAEFEGETKENDEIEANGLNADDNNNVKTTESNE